jgi:hypothetical protein
MGYWTNLLHIHGWKPDAGVGAAFLKALFQITICFKSEQDADLAHALLLRTFAGTEDV